MAPKTLTRNNGKQTLPTPTNSQLNRNESRNESGHAQQEVTDSEQKGRRGNPFMQALNPRMLIEPYPIEGTDLSSDEFACDKCCKLIIQRLGFGSKKEWIQFADLCWTWNEQSEERNKRLEAQKIADKVSEDPVLFEMLKEALGAV